MALVVEDGTAKADSNAYDTAANANAYYTDQGYTETATDATVIRGSRALDGRYRASLKGEKTLPGQAMAWPRDDMDDEDGNPIGANEIPDAWKFAAFEMARAIGADQSVSGESSIKSVKAGSAAVEFSSPLFVRTVLSHVDELVGPYLSGAGNRVVRA